jgi:two-component system nitrogen regulation sensor histidine kinase NtrY
MGDLLRRLTSGLEPEERTKRRNELLLVFLLSFLFLVLLFIEFRLFDISHSLPFVHSIFFLGLVNFNIIVFLLLIFMIFRNVVKVFAERQGRIIGSTLKSKLIAAFVSFSLIPTGLMFIVSVFYINNSFDKWFSTKMAGVLESSLEVTSAFSKSAKRKNFHFAQQIVKQVIDFEREQLKSQLDSYRDLYALDSVEYYPDLFSERVMSLSPDESIPIVPRISLEVLKKGITQQAESSFVHQFAKGNLVRVLVPVARTGGVIVVSTFIPLSLLSKINDISTAYEDFRDTNPLEYPIKAIYLIILTLMALVILLGATWFGFYLAKQFSVPLLELGEAADRVARKDYQTVSIQSGSAEINQLVTHFNSMTRDLKESEEAASKANADLKQTLNQLDEYSRYVEVVLSNIMTGVVSVDRAGRITMVNRYAAKLLEIEPEKYVGKRAKEILSQDDYSLFEDLLISLRTFNAESLKKEVHVAVNGRNVPLQMTLSVLYDDKKNDVGKVLVFDDLTHVVTAQRAAAWTEVARRIAHEIKNPLTPIRLAAQRLRKKFGDQVSDPAFQECTDMIIDQVDNMKGLVNEFSHFARLPKSNPVPADLNSCVEEAIKLYKVGPNANRINFEKDESLPVFMFDPDHMKRVITNLVDNALFALPKGKKGKVDILLQYDTVLKIARITVADNGPGISARLRDRIFEPYVTTKESGTGLGLAIVKRTIEDHNGFIRAFANEPSGTKMIVELPVKAQSMTKSESFRAFTNKESQV